MNSEHTVEWQFGGWSGLPLWLCWVVLLAVAVAGIILAFGFYRHTLSTLTLRQRLIFAALRCGFLLALLLCLAGPARVERVYNAGQDARPLAVIVDRSASMNVVDSRGNTRLAQSLRIWKKVEAAAIRSFPSLGYFHFSSTLASASDLESALNASDSGAETHLFGSLDQALKEAPSGGYGGIVCLTDGLDTTDTASDAVGTRALQNHTPLYFAVGENQQVAGETLLVREMNVPGHALRKSRFTATVLVEGRTTHERDVPVSLFVEKQQVAQATLHLHAGNNLIPWPVSVDTGEPGVLHLEAQLGEGAEQETIAAAVPVVASNQIHILFYQGTLDWSYHFINNALQGDPSFVLTGLFNPSPNLTQMVSSSSLEPLLSNMPANADGLDPYQIVILSNVFGNELSKDQQNALLDYVHGGGGLLFLVSNTAMARTFSGTGLESLLPVVFEGPEKTDAPNSVQQFQNMMHNAVVESDGAAADTSGPLVLQNFALPPNSKRSQIAALFSPGAGGVIKNPPQFASYAHVRALKPGGEVLAVHPQDKNDAGEPRALLVTQRFGEGQVTALLTDALWRWRMALPSTSNDPAVFWQQLLLALARNQTGSTGLRFAVQPFSVSLMQSASFRLDGVHGTDPPTIVAISPGGKYTGISAQPGSQSGSWQFQMQPDEPGTWRIQARDVSGAMMETLLRVSNVAHNAELSGLPPDIDGMRKLAESTGGCLLNNGVPEDWTGLHPGEATTLVSKRSQPLWNNWMLLAIGLGFYVAELLWRRQARLL